LQRGYSKGDKLLPREIALTNIKEDNMKMINDARPNKLITFLATRWPIIAAKNATPVKNRAARNSDKKLLLHAYHRKNQTKGDRQYHMVQGTGSGGSILLRLWKTKTSLQRWL
jgi:hypothetical protein